MFDVLNVRHHLTVQLHIPAVFLLRLFCKHKQVTLFVYEGTGWIKVFQLQLTSVGNL